LGGPQLDGRWFSTAEGRREGTYHQFRSRGGRQKFSWVHLDDVLGSIRFLAERDDLSGALNVSAPNPSDNRTLMRTIRKVLGVPAGLPAFRWMLELGSIAIRTETELILKSRWVLPERLQEAGYEFRHPELEPALGDILARCMAHLPVLRAGSEACESHSATIHPPAIRENIPILLQNSGNQSKASLAHGLNYVHPGATTT